MPRQIFGLDGEVSIEGLNDLSGAIAPLSQRFSQAATVCCVSAVLMRLRMQGAGAGQQIYRCVAVTALPVPPGWHVAQPTVPSNHARCGGARGASKRHRTVHAPGWLAG